MSNPDTAEISTPPATKEVAQTRGAATARPPAPERRGVAACARAGRDYTIGADVERAALTRPYERQPDDPVYRPIRIFVLDPAETRVLGRITTLNVPYEKVTPGPRGALFEVDGLDAVRGELYRQLELNDPIVLIQGGVSPSPSDPRSHQQMVYAVCSSVYAAFRSSLGRVISWGFAGDPDPEDERLRLRLSPFAHGDTNAFYDPQAGALRFGYFRAEPRPAGENLPRGFVFTALSHDVIAHEVTHALLDGLRSHFGLPTGPDVLAFHEGFADLVAILQHFSYEDVVRTALAEHRGDLRQASLLWDLATQFGHTTGSGGPLRTGLESDPHQERRTYDPALECHQLGAVLVSAVFDAFLEIYQRKTARYIRVATRGSGILPEGALQADLCDVLAAEASTLATQFLRMCIRAIDYCPPVDVRFGEFLRAVITADTDLVPDDPWGYRAAWISAFGRRGIYPHSVPNLSQDALRWRLPSASLPPIEGLTFSRLRFRGDPGQPASRDELRRQACVVGEFVTRPENRAAFGLAMSGDPRLRQDVVELPCIHSVRSSRRIGPDGQVVFDTIAEVSQVRHAVGSQPRTPFHGGATVIVGPSGDVRYVIVKSVFGKERLEEQRAFIAGPGQRYWRMGTDEATPRPDALRLVHQTG
jgi:hypothetical protein